MHYCEGGYERIATQLLRELEVDCFYVRTHSLFEGCSETRADGTTDGI